MLRVFSVLAIALLFGRTASAADLPVKAPYWTPPDYEWTGLYVGAGGGIGVGSLRGGIGSLTLGINIQTDWPVVFSAESDLSLSNLTNNSSCSATTCTFQNRWVATTRARVGYMIDQTLLFGYLRPPGLPLAKLMEAGQSVRRARQNSDMWSAVVLSMTLLAIGICKAGAYVEITSTLILATLVVLLAA